MSLKRLADVWYLTVPPITALLVAAFGLTNHWLDMRLTWWLLERPGLHWTFVAVMGMNNLTVFSAIFLAWWLHLPPRKRVNVIGWMLICWPFAIPAWRWFLFPGTSGRSDRSSARCNQVPVELESALRRFYRFSLGCLIVWLLTILSFLVVTFHWTGRI